jgi:hypothetical protein
MSRDLLLNDLAIRLLTAKGGVYVPELGVFYQKRLAVRGGISGERLEPPQFRWFLSRMGAGSVVQGASLWNHSSAELLGAVPVDWTRPFELLGLGRVVPTGVGEGCLEPSHPLLVHFLASCHYPAIVPPRRSAIVALPVASGTAAEGRRKKAGDRLRWLGRAALWLLFIGPLLLLLAQYSTHVGVQQAGTGEVAVHHDSSVLPEFPRLFPPSEPIAEERVDSFGATTDTLQPQNPDSGDNPMVDDAAFTAVVVVGCFVSPQYAERHSARLMAAGFEPAEVPDSRGGLQRVATAMRVGSEEEANTFLALVRSKFNSGAWLLEEYPSH